jgi:glycosyltransferase involved in cell wall biosynthesis
MKICFLVDYRSPIARSWIEYFINSKHNVHVISTHEAMPPAPGPESLHFVRMGLGSLRSRPALRRHLAISTGAESSTRRAMPRGAGSFLRRISVNIQQTYSWIAPYEARFHAKRLARLITDLNPDLVHAMRIPFEGILGARALASSSIAYIVSVWGNDFTLHAANCRPVATATRFVMTRADALHADCERDIRLARKWGLRALEPCLLAPGNGGIRTDVFHPGHRDEAVMAEWGISPDALVVINARNFRPSYVRNDVFFAAMPAVLRAFPATVFLCVGMRGNPIAESWVRQYDVSNAVRLLPIMRREEMATLFRVADIAVSPSNHDGTPNTLIEAMASGAFPVAGDIESVREWVRSGHNGLLCNPNDVDALTTTLVRALGDQRLRERAAAVNQGLIAEKAEYWQAMRRTEIFYQEVIDSVALRRGDAQRLSSTLANSGRVAE